jgi:probable HAF family extracellular repeat protein
MKAISKSVSQLNPDTHSCPLREKRVSIQVAACLALMALPLAVQAQYGLSVLGDLGSGDSYASAISANGKVVVGEFEVPSSTEHAFRWTQSEGLVSLGTLGGQFSWASGISADGSVIVGGSSLANNTGNHAFRWTQGTGMVSIGTLGGDSSWASDVTADGSIVVGASSLTGNTSTHAFRWSQGTGMVGLGSLGGSYSYASGVSADGAVVVGASWTTGNSHSEAFRWTQNTGMVGLGTLGGTHSEAEDVSADGSVVVGNSDIAGNGANHAFRWTQNSGMVSLGTLGGSRSDARGVSGDGKVIVGSARNASDVSRGFRWTESGGMQSVEDWLRAGGIRVAADITDTATATNSDGSIVVGQTVDDRAYIARHYSGLITMSDLHRSLASTTSGNRMATTSAGVVIQGAHSRPLMRRVDQGQKTFWLAGDWGQDNHDSRNGDLGLAEGGFGYNVGSVQLNASLGQTWAEQHLEMGTKSKTDGSYLLVEALIPVSGNLWATLGAYNHWGEADLRRGYLNAGIQDYSKGSPDVDTWSVRGRLDWENAFRLGSTDFTPYADLSYTESKMDSYTETGGGFAARFDSRKDKATELRAGVNSTMPLGNGINLLGTLEAAHRFEKDSASTSGEVIGLFAFNLDGDNYKRDWLRAGVGVEGKLAGGNASLQLNATTQGEVPNAWLAASWQMKF